MDNKLKITLVATAVTAALSSVAHAHSVNKSGAIHTFYDLNHQLANQQRSARKPAAPQAGFALGQNKVRDSQFSEAIKASRNGAERQLPGRTNLLLGC